MFKPILLITLSLFTFTLAAQQILPSFSIENKPVGENIQQLYPYNNGYLVQTTSIGMGTFGCSLRKLNANNQIDWAFELDSVYQDNLNCVITDQEDIFVFGFGLSGWGNSAYAMNFMIMDSMFNITLEKRISFPYPIIRCSFFPAKDGGVIGMVNESCDFSRIMRIDSLGNILWYRGYQCIVTPPGGTGRTIADFIQLKTDGNYMVMGHEAFGSGLLYFELNENGDLLNSHFIDVVTGGDVNVENFYDGNKFYQIVQTGYFRKNTTLLELDDSAQPIAAYRLDLRDSIYYTGGLDILNDNIIISGGFEDASIAAASGVYSINRNAYTLNWGVESDHGDLEYATQYTRTRSVINDQNQITVGYPYGAAVIPGPLFKKTGITVLNEATGQGFCDGYPSPMNLIPVNATLPNRYVEELGTYTWNETLYNSDSIPLTIAEPVKFCEMDVTSIEELEEGNISVYPNPAISDLTVDAPGFNTLKVLNTIGEQVFDINIDQGITTFSVDHIDSGYYLFVFSSSNDVQTRSIVIE